MEQASSAFSTGVPALAAIPQLAGNSRHGFGLVDGTMRWASGWVISSNTLGLSTSLYDSDAGSRSTGKERDAESGNDYFGARYYASSMGRFMSPDWSAKAEPVPYAKLGNPQTLNLYGYMRNNPLGGVDQDGHCDWCQKLLNGITGNGFQTNAQLAAQAQPQATVTANDSGVYTPHTNPEPTSEAEPKEPNEAVALGADVAGLVSAAPGVVPGVPGLALGLAAGSVSSVNDPNAVNLTVNATGGTAGVVSFAAEGTPVGTAATGIGFGVAVGALVWDASNWISNNIITPVFTPDANQSNTIDANGITIAAPNAYDWHQQ